MKIAIIQFPGSNCESETIAAVSRVGMNPVEFLWNQDPAQLSVLDGYIIVGGFSFEDRSRAGIIAALDPLMLVLKKQAELGKPILGICNGAQILVESGLVPGLKNYELGLALSDNKRMLHGKILGTGYYNAWVHLRAASTESAFTRHWPRDTILSVPVAHAEGRFVLPLDLLAELQEKGLDILHYCDETGEIRDQFPINPNGSMANIAALLNPAGNVMALMPHPERTPAGDILFSSMKEYIQAKQRVKPKVLDYQPKPVLPFLYIKKASNFECLTQLMITDNAALSVQNCLKQLGLIVQVSRLTHWEIEAESGAVFSEIKSTGLLCNERKEYWVPTQSHLASSSRAFLVRAIEDLAGQEKMQALEDHYHLQGIQQIQKGTLWIFKNEEANMQELTQAILDTKIIFNPYAQVCYEYALS